MFRLVTSNDAARLADALGARLRAPQSNPLEPARVLVPQAGIRRWLQVHLAERLGIIANVEFTPPAQFAWELLRAARPDLPPRSPFEVEVLRWQLYALLGEPLDGAALAPLRTYLAADGDPLRRYALSFELARAYERMQGYRRTRLAAWEHGAGADWQAELWRRLLPRVGGISRATRVEDWLQRFDPEPRPDASTDRPAPPGLPARLACFGCVNVSPDVLRMLAAAGRHCEVDFYLPLPSMAYLGDLPRTRAAVRARLGERDGENPLLLSLGGALAEFVDLLFGYQQVQPDVEHDDYDAAIPRHTLLGRVRDDILQHAAPAGSDRDALPDASLQFHACHTPLREVETLHDALLAMFDDASFDPPLQPRDVAVMLPDVAAYAPAIEAVFGGSARDVARCIPFNLGDVGATALHPVVQLFLDLLAAPASRWEAGELLDVLAAPGVMRRFDLDADALARLGRRVRAAGVRWGEDEHARKDCGGYREFSWAFGIERMLAGFACGAAAEPLVAGVAPLAGVEGAAFGELEAVLAVTDAWRRLRELARRTLTAQAWQHALNQMLDDLYQPDPRDPAEARALERIRGALAQLADDSEPAGDLALPWDDVRAFLVDRLADADPRQYLFTGGVTFCGMVPLRVVPFRVICLLGMDEAAFPRRVRDGLDPLVADRRAGKAEPGDRDVRADDRLLFLQLLAAARDVFYVSWIGRDARSNKDLPPSVVVAELLDVVRADYLAPPVDATARHARDARLPQREPLHPFDTTLFNADATRSFQREWLPAARTPRRSTDGLRAFVTPPLPAVTAAAEVRLDELQGFLADPARGFLERALQLRLPRGAEADADLEPLQPDAGLLRYQLTSTLLERGDADAPHMQTVLRAQGALPPGELAAAALAIAQARAQALRVAIDTFTGGGAPIAVIDATLALADGTRLSGTVAGVHAAGLVRASAGDLNGRRALAAWIDMLFATVASDAPVACRLFWMEKDKAKHCDLESCTPAQARAKLLALLQAMRAGIRTPLPLFPKASWDALKRTRTQKGEADAAEFIANLGKHADADDRFAQGSELQSPEVRMAWRGVDLAAPDASTAHALYATAAALLPVLQPAKARR